MNSEVVKLWWINELSDELLLIPPLIGLICDYMIPKLNVGDTVKTCPLWTDDAMPLLFSNEKRLTIHWKVAVFHDRYVLLRAINSNQLDTFLPCHKLFPCNFLSAASFVREFL